MIKTRKAKKSQRGIYIQDKELKNTNFKIGSHFKYVIDKQNKQIVILPTDEITSNTVSKRTVKDGLKPVLDIRNKEALAVFGDADYLQIEIQENEILVSGYEQQDDSIVSSLKNKVKKFVSKKKNVVDISSLLNVKKTFDVRLSKEELEQAVGQTSYEQLSIFDVIENTESFTKKSFNYIKKAVSNLHIPLQVLSIFSGSGAMDTAFIEEGYNVAFGLEIDEDAVKTYKCNHDNPIHQGDIREFDKSQFANMGAKILIGGSPCQGFSQANQRTKFLDNPNNLLVREYIESVKAIPDLQVFVMENVPQLLSAGNGQFKAEIEEALADFEITSGVLNAMDYGDPQSRSRAFIIGSKIGRIDLPKPTHTADNYVTVGEAFEGLNNSIPNQLDYSKPKDSTVERMAYVPQGGNWRSLPEHLLTKGMLKGNTHSSIYRRLDLTKPSVTIVNPRKTNLTHPTENRTLSIRECARLFSIKDNFIFKGTLASMQQQICNMTPVKLVRAVANQVKNAVIEHNSLVARNNFSLV